MFGNALFRGHCSNNYSRVVFVTRQDLDIAVTETNKQIFKLIGPEISQY